jgi:hypothetical protein
MSPTWDAVIRRRERRAAVSDSRGVRPGSWILITSEVQDWVGGSAVKNGSPPRSPARLLEVS